MNVLFTRETWEEEEATTRVPDAALNVMLDTFVFTTEVRPPPATRMKVEGRGGMESALRWIEEEDFCVASVTAQL